MSTNLTRFLLGFGALTFTGLMAVLVWSIFGANGIVLADGINPIGGDFVNLWTAGRLVAEGRADEIYAPEAFQVYQLGLTGTSIGFRLWAYPPHSLAIALPFGLMPYLWAYALWSLLGLAVLWAGARAIGLPGAAISILLFSPATALCLYYGQTGNLFAGLMLLALAAPARGKVLPVIAASLLTIKPQSGFLLPVAWAAGRRLLLIAATGVFVCAGIAATILWLGVEPWRQYLGETLPLLSHFERNGTGPFRWMIPSVFMSASILGGNGDLAILIHAGFAALVFVAALVLILSAHSAHQRQVLTLLATALITPYIHIYDLGLVLAAVLVMARFAAVDGAKLSPWHERAVLLAWALPYLTMVFNRLGMPVSPIILIGLFLLAADTLLPRALRLSRPDRV